MLDFILCFFNVRLNSQKIGLKAKGFVAFKNLLGNV